MLFVLDSMNTRVSHGWSFPEPSVLMHILPVCLLTRESRSKLSDMALTQLGSQPHPTHQADMHTPATLVDCPVELPVISTDTNEPQIPSTPVDLLTNSLKRPHHGCRTTQAEASCYIVMGHMSRYRRRTIPIVLTCEGARSSSSCHTNHYEQEIKKDQIKGTMGRGDASSSADIGTEERLGTSHVSKLGRAASMLAERTSFGDEPPSIPSFMGSDRDLDAGNKNPIFSEDILSSIPPYLRWTGGYDPRPEPEEELPFTAPHLRSPGVVEAPTRSSTSLHYSFPSPSTGTSIASMSKNMDRVFLARSESSPSTSTGLGMHTPTSSSSPASSARNAIFEPASLVDDYSHGASDDAGYQSDVDSDSSSHSHNINPEIRVTSPTTISTSGYSDSEAESFTDSFDDDSEADRGPASLSSEESWGAFRRQLHNNRHHIASDDLISALALQQTNLSTPEGQGCNYEQGLEQDLDQTESTLSDPDTTSTSRFGFVRRPRPMLTSIFPRRPSVDSTESGTTVSDPGCKVPIGGV